MPTAQALSATILARDATTERKLRQQLLTEATPWADLQVELFSETQTYGQWVLVDEGLPRLAERLKEVGGRSPEGGRLVTLVLREGADVPRAILEGWVGDALVFPFRGAEVFTRVRLFRDLQLWDEVYRMNQSVSDLAERIRDDVAQAERIQLKKLPERFSDLRGLQVASRYLAGLRSGGDHLDLAESRDQTQLMAVLSDSSSYGMSSAVLGAMGRLAARASLESPRACSEAIETLATEIRGILKPQDRWSIFVAHFNRRDFVLRYLNYGTSRAFYSGAKDPVFLPLTVHGDAWGAKDYAQVEASAVGGMPQTPANPLIRTLPPASEMRLAPGGRLTVMSEGFLEALGGEAEALDLLAQMRGQAAREVTNELVFRVKKDFPEADDLPARDCSVAVVDLDPRALRLA